MSGATCQPAALGATEGQHLHVAEVCRQEHSPGKGRLLRTPKRTSRFKPLGCWWEIEAPEEEGCPLLSPSSTWDSACVFPS